MLIEGKSGTWEMVIGLEVHAHVVSKAKLFSGAATDFGAEPNAQVSFVDAGFPGMLPVINKFVVEQAVKTGLGLGAQINLVSVFDRKNYFYADMPQGYQISQYTRPIVGKGTLTIDLADGSTREIGITRLHLEQDAGKSLHDQHPHKTYVDLNRSGVGLMEIVSEPDIRSPEEAGAYLHKLRSILRYLGTCDGNMEEGSMRCDANVSVRKVGGPLGTRCEIKNVNSMRFVMQAIEYEARRQVDVLEEGGEIKQETRLFDSGRGETRSMRSKENAHDYRYFPDPDLCPLVLDQAWVDDLKANLPELPDAKKARFMRAYGLTSEQASIIVGDRETAEAAEVTYKRTIEKKFQQPQLDQIYTYLKNPFDNVIPQNVATSVTTSSSATTSTIINQGFSIASERKEPIASFIVRLDFSGLQILQENNTISGRLVKDVLPIMAETGKEAAVIVEEKGLKQVTDTGAIEKAVDEVIAANADKVEQIKGGNAKAIGWFVGQVMKSTGGKANPGMVNDILKKKLGV